LSTYKQTSQGKHFEMSGSIRSLLKCKFDVDNWRSVEVELMKHGKVKGYSSRKGTHNATFKSYIEVTPRRISEVHN
jgi:hypothetical protein